MRFSLAALGCLFFLAACETAGNDSRARWHDPLGARQVMDDALHELPYTTPAACSQPDWQPVGAKRRGAICRRCR